MLTYLSNISTYLSQLQWGKRSEVSTLRVGNSGIYPLPSSLPGGTQHGLKKTSSKNERTYSGGLPKVWKTWTLRISFPVALRYCKSLGLLDKLFPVIAFLSPPFSKVVLHIILLTLSGTALRSLYVIFTPLSSGMCSEWPSHQIRATFIFATSSSSVISLLASILHSPRSLMGVDKLLVSYGHYYFTGEQPERRQQMYKKRQPGTPLSLA